MTVIISRDKKHVHLGRMLTATTAKIQLLSDIKKRADALLYKISELDNLYAEWEEVDFPSETLEKMAEEKASVRKIASAYVMVSGVVEKELRTSIQDLNEYEAQLDKAEKSYQKLLKKAEKKAVKKPQASDEIKSADLQTMIEKVSDALTNKEQSPG